MVGRVFERCKERQWGWEREGKSELRRYLGISMSESERDVISIGAGGRQGPQRNGPFPDTHGLRSYTLTASRPVQRSLEFPICAWDLPTT